MKLNILRTSVVALLTATAASAQTNVWTNSGNIGIGTTNPTANLEVTGNVKIGTGTSRPITLWEDSGSIYIQGDSGGWAFGLHAKGSQGTVRGGFGFLGGADNLSYLYIGNSYDNPTAIFQPNNGYVGIGTVTPAGKLHVDAGGTLTDNFFVGSGNTGTGDNTYFTLSRTSVQSGSIQLDAFRSGVGGTNLLLNSRMGGNVGIGTTNPTHKLAVNGTIKAKEVIVETTGWSDYVFADGYALQPLAQVEAHIKEHKHLPGIPSAAEVASQGVNVGAMQAALLAKVEELTLHVIAQEKELTRLRETEKDLAALRAEVRQLRQGK